MQNDDSFFPPKRNIRHNSDGALQEFFFQLCLPFTFAKIQLKIICNPENTVHFIKYVCAYYLSSTSKPTTYFRWVDHFLTLFSLFPSLSPFLDYGFYLSDWTSKTVLRRARHLATFSIKYAKLNTVCILHIGMCVLVCTHTHTHRITRIHAHPFILNIALVWYEVHLRTHYKICLKKGKWHGVQKKGARVT